MDEVLIAVATPITAKLIAKTLEHAGVACRVAGLAEAMNPETQAPLAIVEMGAASASPPPHVVALYDPSMGIIPPPGALGKPVDPDLLVEIVASRLRPSASRAAPSPPADPGVPAVDRRAIEDLRRLGGDDFVREVAEQFFKDADLILATLKQDVRARDVTAFQENAHALRSCAANIGATGVYQFCLNWRQTSEVQLSQDGEGFLQRLDSEIVRIRAAYESGEFGQA